MVSAATVQRGHRTLEPGFIQSRLFNLRNDGAPRRNGLLRRHLVGDRTLNLGRNVFNID